MDVVEDLPCCPHPSGCRIAICWQGHLRWYGPCARELTRDIAASPMLERYPIDPVDADLAGA